MLAEATASCARILAAAKASWQASLLCRELGVCSGDSEGTGDHPKERRSDSSHSGRAISWGIALSLLWPLEILRRRIAGGEGLPSGKRRALFEAGGGRIAGWNTHSAGHGERRTHEITRLPNFRDEGFLRTGYDDIEDFAQIHITFSDGTIADIFSSELVMGGVYNWMEVFVTIIALDAIMNPTNALETFNPREDIFKDIYVVEKISTKQGWSFPAPDEGWQHGYPQEFQDFMESIYHDREPLSGIELARDTIAALYTGYLSVERGGAEVAIPL